MTRYFFITGLPRSRTAWCSNLFTAGRVYCFHDASRMVTEPPKLHEIVHESRVDADFIGTSDNGLPLTPSSLNWYLERDPEVPVVVIRRPQDEVVRSLYKLHQGQIPVKALVQMTDVALAGIKLISSMTNCMEVKFSDLDSMNVLEGMWKHLIPRVPFDMQRAAALRGLNVQYAQPWYDKGFSEAFVRMVAEMNGGLE